MAALPENSQAPDITLSNADGEQVRLIDELKTGPVLLTFFKIACPTCQYGMPYLDRLGKQLSGTSAKMIAISQDTPADTERFNVEFNFESTQLFDSADEQYPASNAYGLSHVPTAFLIEADGRIAHTMESWSKSDVDKFAEKLSVASPFKPGEDVIEYRPG